MKKLTPQIVLHLFSIAILLQFGLTVAVKAERLPFKIYSTADGLANDNVNQIVADSHGFLWFCTDEGLSRFDGYKFKNYTQAQGLPHHNIISLFETNAGDYLIATTNGLAVFNPNGTAYRWDILAEKLEQTSNEPPIFKTYFPADIPAGNISKAILSLAQDGNGNIYAGTNYGLYRIEKKGDDWEFQRIEFADWDGKIVDFNFLFADSRKDIWIATNQAIYWMSKAGEIKKINDSGGNSVFEDRDGKIWIDSGGNEIGIRVFSVQTSGADAVLIRTFTTKDGLVANKFSNAIAQTEDGKIFATSDQKLFEFMPESEPKFRQMENIAVSSATDKSGNIWFTTFQKGAAKYSPKSFATFDQRDGIPDEPINSIFGNQSGEVFFTLREKKTVRVEGGKFETIVPFGLKSRDWIGTFLDLKSKDGEWWIPSVEGLRRYPKVNKFSDLANTPPKKIYTTADGLAGNEIFALFEDSRGDIWISGGKNFFLRWERATGKFYHYTTDDGLPLGSGAVSFGEDAAGNVWVGFFFGQLLRYKDGKFRAFTAEDGIPNGAISKMLSDKNGHFWLSTLSRGLFRVDNPNDSAPKFVNFSTADGLSSNQTLCLTEDNFGRIYVGTGRGLNRIEPETGRVKIYRQEDGLPGNIISQCYKNADGTLWFSSNNSLIQLVPNTDKPSKQPPIFIDGISVNGTARNVSELGETEIQNLEFASDERQIQISFFAISFDSGETLRYQYKLDGQDWSQPNEQRTISFNLAAGNYTFLVQAVNSDGVASEKPAVISFKILPPIYQRWWFLILATAFVCLILLAIYRRRTANLRKINAALTEAKLAEEALSQSREDRLKELQKVRTRIANDLHDDIGSSLTQIAVLSEVARGQAVNLKAENLSTPLERIKNVSKELVAVMSDVVWAINPNKDFLHDLVLRMRRFASDVFTGRGIKFEFHAPKIEGNLSLGANIRREVFAIFKESVNNSVKYSECTNALVDFQIEENLLILKIEDNGKGFDMNEILSDKFKPEMGGNGLVNIKRRALELGGNCQIESEIGAGTKILLTIPLRNAEVPAQTGGDNSNGNDV